MDNMILETYFVWTFESVLGAIMLGLVLTVAGIYFILSFFDWVGKKVKQWKEQ